MDPALVKTIETARYSISALNSLQSYYWRESEFPSTSSCQRTSDIPPLRKRTLIPACFRLRVERFKLSPLFQQRCCQKRARKSNIRANGDNGFSRRRRNGEEISRAQAEPAPVSPSRSTRVYLLTYWLSIFEDECANNRLVSFSFFLLFTFQCENWGLFSFIMGFVAGEVAFSPLLVRFPHLCMFSVVIHMLIECSSSSHGKFWG